MKRYAAAALLLFALVGCNKLPRLSGPEPIVDTDYQFQLVAPERGWQLYREKEIRRISPDAVAGAAETGHAGQNRHGAVTVEPYTSTKLREFAELLIGNMPLEDKQTVSMADVQFEKQPAVRYQITGKLNGVGLHYLNVVFFRDHHAYQVMAWGLLGQVDEKGLLAFSQAFHLIDGPVHDRVNVRPAADERGVGFQVKGGVFHSADDGLTLRSGDGWQLAVGDELERMNSSAEVGLVHSGRAAYLILIPSSLGGTSRVGYAERTLLANVTAMSLVPVAGAPAVVTVDAQTVEFSRYRNPKLAMEYLLGVLFHGDTAYLVMFWYEQGLSPKAPPLLQESLLRLGFVDEPARLALRRELLALPDAQVAIGPTYALRRGVFRDFAAGVSWHKPPGALRIAVGPAARSYNKDATLFFEDRESDLYGMLIAETAHVDAAAYHQAALAGAGMSTGGTRRRPPTAVMLGTLPGLSSVVELTQSELVLTKQMVTAVDDQHAYEVMLWGRPAAMKSGAAWVQAVLAGFSFGAELPLTWHGDAVTDQRLGFAFALPAALGTGWTHKDITPKEVLPLGTILEWKNDHYSLALIAVHAMEKNQDEDWFLEQIRLMMPARSSLLSSSQTVPDQLAGEPARRVSFRNLGQLQGELLLVRRDRTFYCLAIDALTGGLDGRFDPLTTEAIKNGFHFSH